MDASKSKNITSFLLFLSESKSTDNYISDSLRDAYEPKKLRLISKKIDCNSTVHVPIISSVSADAA